MKMKYDLVLGLGPACSCSQTLRQAGLQLLSFPFDWIGPLAGSVWYEDDMRRRVDLIDSEFKDWLHIEDFELAGENTTGMYKYRNTRNGLSFLHDFPIGVPLEQSFPAVVAKFSRRTTRLLELMRKSREILIVRLDRPNLDYRTPVEDCRYAHDVLSRKFLNAKFDFLLMYQNSEIPFGSQKLKMLEPGVFCLEFDYRDKRPGIDPNFPDLRLTSAAVAQLFSVREYRTKAEITAHKDTEKRKRWAKYGATSAWQYRWRKLTEGKALFHLAGIVAARLRQQKIEQIIPIGTNCEVAFRFYCRWGFVDSSLFAWAQTFNIKTISNALACIDTLPTGDFLYGKKANMWLHTATGIYFHGNIRCGKESTPPSEEELIADLADLRGRLGHLVDKFRRYATNEKNTLFIHRLSDDDAESQNLSERIDKLETAIDHLGARNWRILIICRRCDMSRMPPPSPRRLFRSVKMFNPGNMVTNTKIGDSAGWNAIFTEFAPAHILPKSHNFKFE